MSGLGGVIASAVGKQIVSKLGGFAAEEITLQRRFEKDVEEIKEKMEDLEAVLLDADGKSRQEGEGGRVFQRWLTKFKRVAYDVEDVLDELEANKLMKKSQSKVKLWFSRNNQLLQRINMTHKIKDVRNNIDKIEKEGRRELNLMPREARAEGSRNNETFAPIIGEGMKSGMVGRDNQKDKIIGLLLTSEANADISIIPIVGLGGIGKTTLASSVLADKRVNVFDVTLFVNVSQPFDLKKIGCAMLKSLNSSINFDNCTLQFLNENLKTELATRRYLVVLDDLWEEDGEELEKLKRMLQHGCKGSRIVVTTRNLSVVQRLRTGSLANERKICPVPDSDQIDLGVLSSDDCWELMKQRAFGPGDDHRGLEQIGRQIAEKCGGLPLVANALGQVMSELRTVRAWEDIRDTRVDLGLREVHQKKTLERLMLSYYYMKPDFKMCFTYLAAFPKGVVMDGNRLIQQWKALGYIYPGHDGQRCINYLLGMSFLQIPSSPSVSPSPLHDKASLELIMHDLVHDLALIIAADEFGDLDATKNTSWNEARYCRHAQLTNYKNDPEVFKFLPGKVRSLHFRDFGGLQLPQKAFSRSKYIRVLDLSGHSAKGQSAPSNIVLPSSVHRLKLLRYLDSTGLLITSLPKHFHMLQNMETLILSNSLFETLPNNISSLGKLCYLDLSGNSSLNSLPASLGDLSKLSFLNLSGCSMLEKLPESICKLTCLYHLDMSDCCALQELPDKFGSLPKLSFLNMSSCSKITKLPEKVSFPSLEHLNLSSCHELEKLPEDFSDLQKLEFLNLSGCYKVSMLTDSFCQLNHLKYLDLSDCHSLEELPECFGNLFELEYLNLTSCPKLRLLPESLCKLFKLRCLYLSYCLSISKLPSSFGDLKLKILHMNGLGRLGDLPDSIGGMTSLTQFVFHSGHIELSKKIQGIKNRLKLLDRVEHPVHQIESRGCSSIVDLVELPCSELILRDLQNVRHPEEAERVKLRDKSDIRVLVLGEGGKSVLDRLVPPRTLEHFWILGYGSKDFPNWMSHISSYLPFLSELNLDGLKACDCLPPFGALPNLRSLYLGNIPNIRKICKEFYGEGGPCMKLRVLRLELMENLVEWWTTESSEENKEFLLPNLHRLEVTNCTKLKFLPYPPKCMMSMWKVASVSLRTLPVVIRSFTSLTELYLESLEDLETLPVWLGHFGSLQAFDIRDCCNVIYLPESMGNLTTLRDLKLIKCRDLEILPGCLGELTSLEKIYIEDCPNLTYLPESMKNLTALRDLALKECKGLEILPEWLGQLTYLEEISIEEFPYLTSLPESMKNLTALRVLTLKKCEGLETLPELLGQMTSLEEIYIEGCPNLTYLPKSMKNLTTLRDLKLIKCRGLEILPGWLGELTSLEKIYIEDWPNLTYLPESTKNLTALRDLKLVECRGLEILPGWLGELTSLEEIYIRDCPNLTYLPESMKNLTTLRDLTLIECKGLEVLPEWLGELTSLEEIWIEEFPYLTSLPESMKKLTALRDLTLVDCRGLEILPGWLGELTSLNEIYIRDCPNLTYLPESMKNLTTLRDLTLIECRGLEILPEWLKQLTSLEELYISRCPNLTHLPQSIQSLIALKKLSIRQCPSLIARCQGEDAQNICHIPIVEFWNEINEEWETLGEAQERNRVEIMEITAVAE